MMNMSENRNQANPTQDPELQKELDRIETEIDIESSIDEACLRIELAEFERTKGNEYVDAFMDGWNTCMSSFIDFQERYETKHKQLELQHPEWFGDAAQISQ
jgi:hypothetical protein